MLSAQRLAVQRRERRRTGSSMLHQCPCGVPVRCNGLFDNGTLPQRFADPCQRIAGGSKTIASCEQTVLVFEPESLRLRSFRPGFRRLPPVHSSSDQFCPTADRLRKKYPACRTLCRSAAWAVRCSSIVALPGPCGGHGSSEEPRGPGSLTVDRELTGPCQLQRLVRRRTLARICATRSPAAATARTMLAIRAATPALACQVGLGTVAHAGVVLPGAQ